MRLSPTDHRARPWLVHGLARDFDLLDYWRLPVEGDDTPGRDLASFAALVHDDEMPSEGLAGALFRLRMWLGDVFGWDDERSRLPIPGCEERSLVERLPAELAAEAPPFDPRRDFQLVYATAGERLYEISNATVHALMHLSWVPSDGSRRVAHMAVYCKPRGLLGKLYMAAITPFRLFIVYPALLRSLGRRWRAATAAAVAAA